MYGKKLARSLQIILVTFTMLLSGTAAYAAPTGTVLHAFYPHGRDGAYPQSGLVSDGHGNLYGTTYSGGPDDEGTVFELMPDGGGGWSEKVLHNFLLNGSDGTGPYAGLIFDAAGNLYGTTSAGGNYNGGTVFELTPDGHGGWIERKLHNFSGNGSDGVDPQASLVSDHAGNLYGTTTYGGNHGAGTVFQLTPNGTGGWTEKKLHSFNFDGSDGNQPSGGVILDAAGNLYGTTAYGGSYGVGTVFELMPNGSGGWTEKRMHNFNKAAKDGYQPNASLVFDGVGNLYGTTIFGGNYRSGTVFELSPNGSGGWTEKKLHNFNENGSDGAFLYGNLIFDFLGNLYGTTIQGGSFGFGTVFELSSDGSGHWTEKKLHNFRYNGADGNFLSAGLIPGTAGKLYGTTSRGGAGSVGTVFELTPEESGSWTEQALYSFNFHGSDGASPYLASLTSDAAGNLYGTTPNGGAYDAGILFELTPDGSGGWTEKVLHDFKNNNHDGGYPYGKLIFDNAGNLYGTTLEGGSQGIGTVFKLTRQSGSWAATVVHNFGDGTDGSFPQAGLTFDAHGNLYGTTYQGGIYGWGTIFELTPNGSGGWIETKLYDFNHNDTDGYFPYAGLIIDGAGNLYGTTSQGGTHRGGIAFELMPNGSGGWIEKKLYDFGVNGTDGFNPFAALTLDGRGNLYGTTVSGGSQASGTVFGLTPDGSGGWTEQILHNFDYYGGDGSGPYGEVIFDARGNLYGTTSYSGDDNGGTVFELMPDGSGGWTERKLHSFSNDGHDGIVPQGGLLRDLTGNLYGMTSSGGSHGRGTVFEITP